MVHANAAFVLIGGFAVIANRFVRATEDIDLLIPDDPDNDRRVLSALTSLGGVRLRDGQPVCEEHIIGSEHLRASTNAGLIDIIRGGLPPLDFVANTSPNAPRWATSPRATSTRSPPSSTAARDRRSAG